MLMDWVYDGSQYLLYDAAKVFINKYKDYVDNSYVWINEKPQEASYFKRINIKELFIC
jgi:hypothetical protein